MSSPICLKTILRYHHPSISAQDQAQVSLSYTTAGWKSYCGEKRKRDYTEDGGFKMQCVCQPLETVYSILEVKKVGNHFSQITLEFTCELTLRDSFEKIQLLYEWTSTRVFALQASC